MNLKNLYLLIFLIFIGIGTGFSQLIFEINQPANLAGVYPSMAPDSQWNSPNLYTNGNWFSDSIVIANDGTEASACAALTSNVANQFAIFRRSECSFDDQLLNVQLAGANGAIIIDDVVGRPLPFSSLPQSGLITIPFVIISLDEGDSIIAAINAGQTSVVSFGDKTSYLTNDLGIYMETSIWSSYGYYPLTNSSYFTDTLLGAWVYNHGNSLVSEVQIQFFLKGKNSSIDEQVISATQTIIPGDSLYIPISFPNVIDFSIENQGLEYGYNLLSSIVDEDTLDNQIESKLLFKTVNFGNSNCPLISPSFFNDVSTKTSFDYMQSLNPGEEYSVGYKVIKPYQICSVKNAFGMAADPLNHFIESNLYDFGNYDGSNFYTGPTVVVNYSNPGAIGPSFINNFNYLTDDDVNYDTIGVVYIFNGVDSIGYVTDMYHDEKRKRFPAEKVLFYNFENQAELDLRLTPCSYILITSELADCYVGLYENESSDLSIFPNPSDGNFNLKIENEFVDCKLFDISGKEHNIKLLKKEANIYSYQADVSDGVYYLQILTEFGKISTNKLIINND